MKKKIVAQTVVHYINPMVFDLQLKSLYHAGIQHHSMDVAFLALTYQWKVMDMSVMHFLTCCPRDKNVTNGSVKVDQHRDIFGNDSVSIGRKIEWEAE